MGSHSIPLNAASQEIYPHEAWAWISKRGLNQAPVIIDVGTRKEFNYQHLEGAINISLLSRFFKARIKKLDRHRCYIVYCKVGVRSKVARKLMGGYGFRSVYAITGGTILWEEERLPFAADAHNSDHISFCPVAMLSKLGRTTKKVMRQRLSHPKSSDSIKVIQKNKN